LNDVQNVDSGTNIALFVLTKMAFLVFLVLTDVNMMFNFYLIFTNAIRKSVFCV